MSTLINEIDARTRLAGANQMELLLFKLGTNEIFGINVFKVREVMKLPTLTQINWRDRSSQRNAVEDRGELSRSSGGHIAQE